MKKTKWIWIWAAIGLILGIIIFWPSNRGNKEAILEASAVEEVVDTTEQQQIHYKYGIPDENFIIEEGTVGKNENLSLILSKYKVSPAKIHEISQRCKDVFDVRSIRRGQNYTLFLAQDSLRTPEFFIYEKNALEYVVIDFKETADVYVGKKDIVTKEKTANIIINSNLWNAMVDAQTDPMLAVTLSDIYAWSIDFYGIAKGDSVRVLYEQSYVEDKPLQDFNVKAAIFTNSGKDFYAIPFEQNEKLAYFDEEGYVDGTFNTHFLKLSAAERSRNLNQAKTLLLAKTNEELKEYPISLEMRVLKRLTDLVISGGLMLLLSPILLVRILYGKAVCGTVFEKQECTTKGGKSFFLHTFVRKDGKTTWMTSLPMLWDVFRGKMSVVGPRPLTKKEMDALIKENPRYFYRLRVQAGLTGYAQVYGKKTSAQEDLLKLDLIYIQHFSALMDMKLMLLSLQGESRQ